MKTFWHTNLSQEKVMAIAKKQSEKFGVSFAFSRAHGGWAIRPCLDNSIIPDSTHLTEVLNVLKAPTGVWGLVGFTEIVDRTGLNLKDVLAVAKFINIGSNRKDGIEKISCDIDRSGKVVGMHIVKG
jgi:hypothetical protein